MLVAYHNNKAEKAAILKQLRSHRKADEIVKGLYWDHGKGCAVGCTIHGSDHSQYESRFGIPVVLARLEDTIFERLPNDEAKDWPIKFMSAIKVGADLSMVWSHFALWLLVDPTEGAVKFVKPGSQQENSIRGVAALFERRIGGTNPSTDEWSTARAAAYAARAAARAAYAADAAVYAADAADAAVYAAAYAYAAAVYAAADAAADAARAAGAYAARQKAASRQSQKLLEIIAQCKPA